MKQAICMAGRLHGLLKPCSCMQARSNQQCTSPEEGTGRHTKAGNIIGVKPARRQSGSPGCG